MVNLQEILAKRCLAVCGFLIREEKILLVFHKKLGIWLAPGGHVEENELPHKAAEREFWEETKIIVKVISATPMLKGKNSEYLPMPFTINLHWINKGGCEQHYVLVYLMKAEGSLKLVENKVETDGIGWFALPEVKKLKTTEDIKQEIKLAFKIVDKINGQDR